MDAAQLRELAEPIVRQFDCEIVLLTFMQEKPGWVLRLLVEKAGSDPFVSSGVDHQVCSGISRQLGELLEDDTILDKHFVLEVSSPGIERPLACEADYVRFVGRDAKVKMRSAVDGQKRFQGKIVGAADGIVKLEIKAGKMSVELPMEQIAKANLVFDMKMLRKKSGV